MDRETIDRILGEVSEATDPAWRAQALVAIRDVARSRPTFICDDVWDAGLPSTRNDKALGPVMMLAAKSGICRKTDRVRPSKRSHLSGKPVWESLICA